MSKYINKDILIDLLKQQHTESSKLYYSNFEDNIQEINNVCGYSK